MNQRQWQPRPYQPNYLGQQGDFNSQVVDRDNKAQGEVGETRHHPHVLNNNKPKLESKDKVKTPVNMAILVVNHIIEGCVPHLIKGVENVDE